MTGPGPSPCLCHWLFYFPFCLFLPHEHTKCFCHFWESNKLHYWEETGSNTHRQKSVFTWMLKAVSHDGKWNVWKSTGWIKRALAKWWVFIACACTWCCVNTLAQRLLRVPEWLLLWRSYFQSPQQVAFWCWRTLGIYQGSLRVEQGEEGPSLAVGFRSGIRSHFHDIEDAETWSTHSPLSTDGVERTLKTQPWWPQITASLFSVSLA